MSKLPAEIRLKYIDEILGNCERGLFSPEEALARITIWTRDDEDDSSKE